VKILIVEDEPLISSFVRKGLAAEGHLIEVAADGEAGLRQAATFEPDIVLLDVMLPGIDGFDVLAALRARDPELPVIMLTARGDVEDRVRGLDHGATDYVVKPFAFAELAARVRAHLRPRRTGHERGLKRADSLVVGHLELDLLIREARVGTASAELSAREFALLAYLMRHPRQVMSRQQILDGVWGYSFDPRSNVVDVYVGYLRGKLEPIVGGTVIETVRGVGYRLVSA